MSEVLTWVVIVIVGAGILIAFIYCADRAHRKKFRKLLEVLAGPAGNEKLSGWKLADKAAVSRGGVYTTLSWLADGGHVTIHRRVAQQSSESGHESSGDADEPRQYYRITDEGRDFLRELREEQKCL